MYCTTERDQETGKVRWRELKVAAVSEGRPPPQAREQEPSAETQETIGSQIPVRTRLARWVAGQAPPPQIAAPDQATAVTYVVETGAWERFGPRLWAELWERGMRRLAHDVVVVADGSDHIDHVVDDELRLPGIQLTRILDIAHAQQHLWAVSKAGFGEGTAAGRTWVQGPLTALERGHLALVLET
jgi:hypothetical protein